MKAVFKTFENINGLKTCQNQLQKSDVSAAVGLTNFGNFGFGHFQVRPQLFAAAVEVPTAEL